MNIKKTYLLAYVLRKVVVLICFKTREGGDKDGCL